MRSTGIRMGTARTRRGLLCAALGLAAVVSGCGAPRTTDEAVPQRFIEAPAVAQNARQIFGDRAEEAYRELAQFSIDQWLKPALVDPGAPDPSADALSEGIVPRLDPATVPHWQNSVSAALRGNAEEVNTVRMLRFFKLEAPTLRMPDGGRSPIAGEGITEGTVGLGQVRSDGIATLVVSFRQRARIDLLNGRSPTAVNLRKKITMTVVPVDELSRVSPTVGEAPAAPPTVTGATKPATASSAPGPVLGTSAASTRTTRDPSVKWLITTFEGDITTTDTGGGSDDSSGSPGSKSTPSATSAAAPVPPTSPGPTRSPALAR